MLKAAINAVPSNCLMQSYRANPSHGIHQPRPWRFTRRLPQAEEKNRSPKAWNASLGQFPTRIPQKANPSGLLQMLQIR
ncbi:unnamed protein product [Blepharisma stoltei]|uniref:Uncharacterized protein n=1 Tax=Blepharisma stoltei TaxID=1481888 RepID=A0AAU9J3B1_9CILI|nr:unnamed protein product [Blepharisma stoltei]